MPETALLPFDVHPVLNSRCEALARALAPQPYIVAAYSGGVDSTFLAWFASRVLQKKLFAVFVNSPFVSRREHEWAHRVAQEVGFHLEEIIFDPTSIQSIRSNPPLRCYHCKRAIMALVKRRAGDLNCAFIADGTHAGDASGYRPGRKALEELGISSPLAEAGLNKADVRELSRRAGLPTWNRPSQSCLATRVDYNTELTEELLAKIESAESLLFELGLSLVRVRVHGKLARIEADPEDFSKLINEPVRETILTGFRRLGFIHITLDLAGYRSGSWDTEWMQNGEPQEG